MNKQIELLRFLFTKLFYTYKCITIYFTAMSSIKKLNRKTTSNITNGQQIELRDLRLVTVKQLHQKKNTVEMILFKQKRTKFNNAFKNICKHVYVILSNTLIALDEAKVTIRINLRM